jgi:hypothetical protein
VPARLTVNECTSTSITPRTNDASASPGRLDPEHVVGVHVTQLFSFPSGDPTELVDLTEDEQAGIAHL